MIELPASLATHLAAWIKDSNPKGDESDAEDIKRILAEFVDAHTICRATIERKLRDQLGNYQIDFNNIRKRIRIWDTDVTLNVTGQGRSGHLSLDSSDFDSSDDLSRIAGYAEELENSVWDDDAVESLIEKWFDLED